MSNELKIFLAAFTGAVLQECIYWYGQRTNLSSEMLPAHWKIYCIITVLMIFGSSCGTLFWYYDQSKSIDLKDALITGAAFPAILKIVTQSYIQNSQSKTRMGGASLKNGMAQYFGGRR